MSNSRGKVYADVPHLLAKERGNAHKSTSTSSSNMGSSRPHKRIRSNAAGRAPTPALVERLLDDTTPPPPALDSQQSVSAATAVAAEGVLVDKLVELTEEIRHARHPREVQQVAEAISAVCRAISDVKRLHDL